MPSYYDSKKKQPGKAEVKYKKGGKVKYDEGGTVKPKPRKRGPVKPSYRKKVSTRLATKARDAERLLPHPYYVKDGNPIPKMESNPRKRNWVVDKDGKPLPKGNSNVKQLLSKGGQLKVTGMGAATRGGNFTRNG